MTSPWNIETPPKTERWLVYLVACGSLLIFGVLLATIIYGCQATLVRHNRPSGVAGVEVDSLRQRAGHFGQAIEFLNRLDEFDATQVHQQILYHLHEWISKQDPDETWFADPLFNRLPKRFAAAKHPETLPKLQFQPHDVYVLQEAVWLRDIARAVAARETPDPQLRDWFRQVAVNLGPDHAHDLAIAERLFDWTVRNIQLESPADPAAETAQQEGVKGDGQPSKPAIPEPGTRRYAWEALLLGRGDWLERSRLFILLARQQGVHAVMLATGTADADGEPEPWLPAVLINNQLFLFDMQLGLPVPGPEGRGIATLTRVLDDPQLLRQLDVEPDFTYRIKSTDLDAITALIDATPAYLSQRMSLVESHLSGDRKMVLTVSATPIGKRLRKCRGIANVHIWTLPYKGFQYRRVMARDPRAVARVAREHRVFEGLSPLARGRILHFRGVFEQQGQLLGAKGHYLRCRTPDEVIEKVAESAEAADAAGIKDKLPDDPVLRDRLLKQARDAMKEMKQHASYWLGLIAFDTAQFEVAIDYFQKRTLDAAPQGPWTPGARYNLARSYEALGLRDDDQRHLQRARQLYLDDQDALYRHGNLLRARRLAALLAAAGE